MADVFVSYARLDRARVAPLVDIITAQGWTVWWDPEITPGQEFDDQIDAEIDAAKAVMVVWTPNSVTSRWVRGESREAADRGILVPVRFDNARLPMDVRAIHTTDLDDWGGDPASPPAQEFLHALGAMIARAPSQAVGPGDHSDQAADKPAPKFTVCVLPFTNMSGDPEQEYFSDGITEDVITDLSKVSALGIISRNSAFMYKGTHVDIPKVARELKVSHVLEGSVRKAGGRVRISAQLVDAKTNNHIWAERYDRDSSDIFALQDEISEAIVKALRLKLLPKEKKAIETRGTENAEAHNLYLMARQTHVTGQESDARSAEAIVRLCTRIIEIDPNYAQAWALMAIGYMKLREARVESYEVNRSAGRLNYQLHNYETAVQHYEKSAHLMEADLNSASLLISAYTALGDSAGTQRAAEMALKRAELVLAHDQNNSMVAGYSAYALAALGEGERAKSRMDRALLIDPENHNMRYNFGCALCTFLKDKEAALSMLGPVFDTVTDSFLPYIKADPDLDLLRDEPRFIEMLATADARLGQVEEQSSSDT